MSLAEFMSTTIGQIITWLLTGSAMIIAVSFVYYLWKRGKFNLDQETISAYEKNVEALDRRIRTLEESEKEKDSKIEDLTTTVRKLEGRNEALERTLALRDPKFQENFNKMLACIQELQKQFNSHAEEDDQRFGAIIESTEKNGAKLDKILEKIC